VNEETLAPWGLSRLKQTNKKLKREISSIIKKQVQVSMKSNFLKYIFCVKDHIYLRTVYHFIAEKFRTASLGFRIFLSHEADRK
jgi:hypothetical protein